MVKEIVEGSQVKLEDSWVTQKGLGVGAMGAGEKSPR